MNASDAAAALVTEQGWLHDAAEDKWRPGMWASKGALQRRRNPELPSAGPVISSPAPDVHPPSPMLWGARRFGMNHFGSKQVTDKQNRFEEKANPNRERLSAILELLSGYGHVERMR
eukprot:5355035-Pyramimonas_sp.AAC.1